MSRYEYGLFNENPEGLIEYLSKRKELTELDRKSIHDQFGKLESSLDIAKDIARATVIHRSVQGYPIKVSKVIIKQREIIVRSWEELS